MLKKVFVFIYPFLMLMSCHSNAQESELVDGNLKFTFTKDSEKKKYWLTKTELNGIKFIKDISEIAYLVEFCNENLKIEISDERRKLSQLTEYGFQDFNSNNSFIHKGGDIYIDSFGNIIVGFYVKAKVLKLNEPPCTNFKFQSTYSCPVELDSEKYPILIIYDVIESSSYSSDYLDNENLILYEKDYFNFNQCD